MAIVYGSPFKVDWTDLHSVIKYAEKLGPGVAVAKLAKRKNYNIIHTVYIQKYKNLGYAIIHEVRRKDRGQT